MTRENLSKRKKLEDISCLFCSIPESVQHAFFERVVAKQCWVEISEIVDIHLGDNLAEIEIFWLSVKKYGLLNIRAMLRYKHYLPGGNSSKQSKPFIY